MKSAAQILVSVLVFLQVACLYAQSELDRNDFNIDVVTGPVLASSRIVGMGGAYVPLAEGINAVSWNPAAYGSRHLFEQDWFEWDLSFSLFRPGVFGQDDFFNNGSGVSVGRFMFVNLGLRLQFGLFGLGVDTRIQQYETNHDGAATNIEMSEGHFGMAYGFFQGRLITGLGLRMANLTMKTPQGGKLVDFNGQGLESGVLLKLPGKPWRLGVAARLPVESTQRQNGSGQTVTEVQGYVLPRKVYMPWEIQLGVAWQFGARPLNRAWRDPIDPAREQNRRLALQRCKRAAAQIVRERGREGLPRKGQNLCPGLAELPRDSDWWLKENRIRQAEDSALEKKIEYLKRMHASGLRASYEEIPRKYLLLSSELLLIGPTSQGIGMDGFLEQIRSESGKNVSIGFRLGAETEPVVDLLKVRLGSYLEPARTMQAKIRLHGTASFEIRLFRWDFFQTVRPFDLSISFTGDFADGYIDMGLGIGFWH